MAASPSAPPSSAQLRACFDAPSPLAVGLEEELFVLDAETLDLAPRADELVTADPRAKPELVAAQIELATPPCAGVEEAAAHLADGRRALDGAAHERGLRLMGAGAHPFADTEGALTPGERYQAIAERYGIVARRQLVAALQVHVAVRPADRALAVHNALRAHLPEIAALAANAPFHGGRDTGLASIRPVIAGQLPRQGVPPVLESWDAYAAALRLIGDPGRWWWEVRPHPAFGTLELRVPDSQATLADARAIATVAYGTVAWLAARHEAGEDLPVVETWKIEQHRWAALRYGPVGEMGERAAALLDAIAPHAGDLEHARALLAAGGPATRLREAAGGDVRAATAQLAERFLEGLVG
jgi:carboxylate-amine ligase